REKDTDTFWTVLLPFINLLEDIAILKSEGAISGDLIFKLWGAHYAETWALWSATVDYMRAREKKRGIYLDLQVLAQEMADRLRAEGSQLLSEVGSDRP